MATKTVLKSDSGFIITYFIRFGRILIIETNFNPFNALQLCDTRITEITEVDRVHNLSVFPDGTGLVLAILKENYQPDKLYLQLDKAFQTYFLNV